MNTSQKGERSKTLYLLGAAILLVLYPNAAPSQNISAAAKENMQSLHEKIQKAAAGQHGFILDVIKSFPDEEMENRDIYLWDPNRIVLDEEGNILISDTGAGKVSIFSGNGNYLGSFGRKGNGPGEFMNPFCMFYDGLKKNVIISDTGNYHIQRYSKRGNFLASFRVSKAYVEIAVHPDHGSVYGAPLSHVTGKPLIDVFDDNGKVIQSMIEPRFHSDKGFQFANMIKFDFSRNGDIYIVFNYFPIICRYSAKGELIEEWKIDDPVSRIIEDNNRHWIEGAATTPGLISFAASIKVAESGFYLLQTVPITKITKYSFSGQIIKTLFYLPKEEGFRALDFALQESHADGGDETAFLLEVKPQSRALILRQRRGSEEVRL